MKSQTLLFFTLFFLCTVFSNWRCDSNHGRDTVIRGTVIDSKTAVRIQDAYIIYSLFRFGKHFGTHQLKTDSNGSFEIEYGANESISNIEISKSGYFTSFGFDAPERVIGELNQVNFKLLPKDGWLRIDYDNPSLKNQKIYLKALSKSLDLNYGKMAYVFHQPYPVNMAETSAFTSQSAFSSDELVYLYWDTIPIIPNTHSSTHQDSFFLAQGDTLVYRVEL